MTMKQKIKDFYNKHKFGCKVAGGVALSGAAIGAGYLALKAIDRADNANAQLEQEVESRATYLANSIGEYDMMQAQVREEHKEDFEKLKSLAEELNLDDDMSAIIAKPNSLYGNGKDELIYLMKDEWYFTKGDEEEES